MQAKDLAAVAAVAVSLGSAWFAHDARQQAEALAKQQFETEKTLEILRSIHTELRNAANKEQRRQSCVFAGALGRAELDIRDAPPFLVSGFLSQLRDSAAIGPDCAVQLEDLFAEYASRTGRLAAEAAAPRSSPQGYGGDDGLEQAIIIGAEGESAPAAVEGRDEIGAWHAVIASYDATPRGCNFARRDVAGFAERLGAAGMERRHVAVYRTAISNHYVVTVDFGDDRAGAEAGSRAVRRAAPDDGTGADSYVQGNRGWTVDADACETSAWTRPAF